MALGKGLGRPLARALGATTAIQPGGIFNPTRRIAYGAGGDVGQTAAGTYFIPVPADCTLFRVKLWGGPGGNGTYQGGPGGYAEALIPVTPGETLTLVVASAGTPTGVTPVAGSPGGGLGDQTYGGSGGGYTALYRGSKLLLLAGGGGGGSDGGRGGSGGGPLGQAGTSMTSLQGIKNGRGGTQSAPGLNGDNGGPTASQFQGASFQGGGAGGGGLFGGGAGVLENFVGRGGGGGGSGYSHPTDIISVANLAGDTDPPMTTDADYAANAGRPGNPGRAVFRY